LGFTFVRYHSHFLPDECYAAADAVGMLLQASLPVEYSRFYFEPPMHGGDGPGVGTAAGHALLQRTWNASVVRVRNHPSVVSFSMGNEAYYVAPGTPRQQNRTWDDAAAKYSWARQLAPHQLIVDTDGVVPSAERGRATLDYYAADFNVGSDMVEDPRKYEAYAPYNYDRPMIAHEFGK
jgi:beta-galactosidase/beta-glucuronidase